MIQRLDIENIKSFRGRHEIPLAPITLIYGPNSSGKSTVLQSLAILKQTLDPSAARFDLEQPSLALHGELVDLGSFSTAITGHDTSSRLFIGVSFTEPPSELPRSQILNELPQYCGLGFAYSHERHAPTLRRTVIGSDETPLAFEVRPANEHPDGQRGIPFRLMAESRNMLTEALADRIRGNRGPSRAAFEAWHDDVQAELAAGKFPIFVGRYLFPEQPVVTGKDAESEQIVAAPYPIGYQLFGTRTNALYELFSRLAYLGPLRAAPKRFQVLSGEEHGTVGTTGEHTAVILARHAQLQRDVNAWLKRLEIPYRLSIDHLSGDVSGVELGDIIVTALHDTRNELTVTPQDVGFGISQLLPVIAQLLQGGQRTICVEQPEIHVHPGLQTKVGDLLLDAARPGLRNQVIVETHSEHLMLRIQRRMRERRFDWLTPEKVAVIYVESDEQGSSHARRLRLDEDGFFVDEWPKGFFSERVDELFDDADP
jgi:energy-coupling factor transporter ATP-binding protein EcfA2